MLNRPSFLDYFSDLKDPRSSINLLHPVDEILLLTLTAVISGSEGFKDIELFGKCKIDFLKTFLLFKNGIPSDDTLRRFFTAVDPNQFQELFITWVESFQFDLKGQVIAIDGKTSRHSFDHNKKPLHLLSAFVSQARIVLGQQATTQKSNEITAIPELLDLLDIKGATITIDAMGCQKNIAKKIKEKEADYILAVKANQSNLQKDIEQKFKQKTSNKEVKSAFTVDNAHGRTEIRKIVVNSSIDELKSIHDWEDLSSIIAVHSTTVRKDKVSSEIRYYISSLKFDQPEKLLSKIRDHWGIENSLHWVLDMSYEDDLSRIRKGNAANNIAIVRHISLNMIQNVKKKGESIKGLRKSAGWSHSKLKEILLQ